MSPERHGTDERARQVDRRLPGVQLELDIDGTACGTRDPPRVALTEREEHVAVVVLGRTRSVVSVGLDLRPGAVGVLALDPPGVAGRRVPNVTLPQSTSTSIEAA